MNAKVAYLSAEFGLESSLPIYSGGLGILAGDYMKAANDNGFPLVAVGILYRKGYFRQRILEDGSQQVSYRIMNRDELPIEPVTCEDGQYLLISVPIQRRQVQLMVWRAEVGSVSVYLLDADIEANLAEDRTLTHRLYGGGQRERMCHEIILGIGGVRCLRAMGERPLVWHLNEGHVAFSSLERLREYSAQGLDFATAVEAVRSTTVFTTHTPVAAGHDSFEIELIDEYFGDFYWQLGADRDTVLQLGIVENRLNMTRLAFSLAAKVNGVSQIHALVTKQLFHQWLPHIPAEDIAVEAITNGVHVDTWLAPALKQLYDQYLVPDWSLKVPDGDLWQRIYGISDEELWAAHQSSKRSMLERFQLPVEENCFIVGFARRFATYKRATLLFQDLPRLKQLVMDNDRPLTFIFAGKAHPNDVPGQDLIRRIVEVSHMQAFQERIFILEDYDIDVAQRLVQGVDLWLNTPIKPMEASGTSGQKAGINGVINCSIRDGWWDEGFNGNNGWAIPGCTELSAEQRDWKDSQALYDILEQEVIPLYYDRDDSGVAHGWIARMKESIRSVTPNFSAARMLRDYEGRLYTPTIERSAQLFANNFSLAIEIAHYKQFIRKNWSAVRILSLEFQQGKTAPNNDYQYGLDSHRVISEVLVEVYLGPIWARDVRVEAVGSNGIGGIWRNNLEFTAELRPGVYLYRGSFLGVRDDWKRSGANVRVFPIGDNFASEFELELSTWAQE